MSEGSAAGKRIVPKADGASVQDANDIQEILENAAPEVLKVIPRKRREELARLISLRQTTVHYSHSGPLPSPDDLKKYDGAVPGAAERIIRMAENQQNHRMRLEDKAIGEQLDQSRRGQHYGLLVAVLMITASGVMVMTGHDTAGGFLGGTTLLGLVGVFVTGKYMQAADLSGKREKAK